MVTTVCKAEEGQEGCVYYFHVFVTVGLLALTTQGGHGFLVGAAMLSGIRLAFCNPSLPFFNCA